MAIYGHGTSMHSDKGVGRTALVMTGMSNEESVCASGYKALHTITYGQKTYNYLDFHLWNCMEEKALHAWLKGITSYQIIVIKQRFGGAKRPQSSAEGGVFCCFMQVIW